MVNGYRLTESNYDRVIEALHDRYGNQDVAINAHLEQLLGLRSAEADTGSLQSTYDQCERHIRSLVALGLSEETFGLVFAPIILSKLPKFLRVELHRQNGSKTWEINKLRELFKGELKARQMGEWSLGGGSKGPKSNPSDPNKKGQGGKQEPPGKKPHHSATFLQGGKQQGGQQGPKVGCIFCGGTHYSDECTKITDYQSRKLIVVRGKHCFKCLSNKHQIRDCPKSSRCFHCGEMSHHSALCANKGTGPNHNASFAGSSTPVGQMGSSPPNQSPNSAHAGGQGQPHVGSSPVLNPIASSFAPKPVSNNAAAADGSSVHLQMALVTFVQGNKRLTGRMFLDPGGSSCYVKTKLKNDLGLSTFGSTRVSNARFGDQTRDVRSYETTVIPIPTPDGSTIEVQAYVTDTISPPLQKAPLAVSQHPLLQQVRLSDSFSDKPGFLSIDILIGADHYFDFVGSEQIRLGNGLLLLGSRFGYIVVGKDGTPFCNSNRRGETTMMATTMLNFSNAGPRVRNPAIERCWALDSMGVTDDPYQNDDDVAVQHFNNHIEKIGNRYYAAFPFKEENPDLPDNYDMALARLKGQCRRQKPEFLTEYDKILKNQVQMGVIEEVTPKTPTDPRGLVHYLPHHAVVKPTSVTTKIRVVHDASAKATKDAVSLNECLLRGPVFLGDLCGLVLRFRMRVVAFVCDIEKAFFQVGLREANRDVTRFIWLRDPFRPVTPDNLMVYRFARVPFGVISSPFLLDATVKHHLLANSSEISHDIASNIYVDNVISGANTTDQANQYYDETQRVFNQISMNVREWFSNDNVFLNSLPEEHKGASNQTRVLGMVWDTDTDLLGYDDPKLDDLSVRTKRHLIQAVSSIYDPCGFISPIITKAKVLVQDTWCHHIKWDDSLPETFLSAWGTMKGEISGIPKIRIPRFLGGGFQDHWELHCFCDASAKAYAAAVYLRSFSGKSSLTFAKCRLTPIKSISLPRLELMGVRTGSRLVRFVKSQLPIKFKRTVIWSDSKCVRSWIASSKLLSVFVSNRVREIKSIESEFRYVSSASNPANIPTRGASSEELKGSKLWWNGPKFLESCESEWPATASVSISDTSEDLTQADSLLAGTSVDTVDLGGFLGIETSRFSSLGRLLRVTAYTLRFVRKLRKKVAKKPSDLSPENTKCLWVHEIRDARLQWVLHVQNGLQSSRKFPNLQRQLGLFKDVQGVWRCAGRLKNANLPDGTKYPAFLPNTHPFTFLVIADCHLKMYHAGVLHTLAEVRTNYWVPSGQSVVSRSIKRCQVCKVWEGGPYKPPPYPPLPDFRVTKCEPFTHTGVDYLGPLLVRQNGSTVKVWICLFTCAVTRAIHLEVVKDMTTDQFLLSLRRFIALCRRPKMLISDNGKYFRLANDVFKRLWNEICISPEIREFLAGQEIQWKFIPEYAPWMGGFYERLVGSVKRALRNLLGRKLVSIDLLQTMVAEIGAILNTRPIVISNDLNDQVLTPANLMGRRDRLGLPGSVGGEYDPVFVPNPNLASDLVRRWKDNDTMMNQFWNMWHRQYLTALRQRREVPGGVRGASKEG